MSPRTEEQFGEMREQRKAAIMRAGLELFAQYSIESTSIAMIAKHAGISKGLMYNYFESKEALIVAVVSKGMDEFVKITPQIENGTITREQLEEYLDFTIDVLVRNISYWKLYFSVLMQPSVMKLVESQLMETIMPVIMMMSNYYESKGYTNPMAHAMLLGATLDGISLNYMVDPEQFPLQDIKEIIKQKLL